MPVRRSTSSISLSDTDRRVLVIALIIILIAFLLAALIGIAIRHTMLYQSKRAEAFMHDVAVTHVVATPREFRTLGFKKNNRALFRDSIKPFLVALLGLAIWIIYNIATGNWGENPWAHFGELFFRFKFDNSEYPATDPLWVKVFGMTILARWPEAVEGYPRFEVAHIASYIEVALWIVSIAWYAYSCQAYIARAMRIIRLSNTVYEKSLEGFNANANVDITPEAPIPPSD